MSGLNRRRFVGLVGRSALGVARGTWLGGCARFARSRRVGPNFVFILIDDMGWTDLGCYGSRYYETPNIDRLASEGMRFTNAYAACAVCSPTRASILTGRYPVRMGITDWIRARFQGGKMPPDGKNPTGYVGGPNRKLLCPRNALWMELGEVTLAEALKPAGYVSCHIGKWHLGMDNWYPERQGFDYNIGGCDFGQPPSYFDPYCNKRQGCIPTLKPRRKGEYLTDREADEAVRFIERHRDRPFFLYLAHYAVHLPLEAKPDLVAKYKAKKPTNQKNPVYAAMVESVDQAAGKVMEALDRLGLADRTVVIFTSDNGGLTLIPVTSNAPLRSGKGTPYEGGIRVPLIIRWPGVVRPGSVCDVPVTSVDFFPTILEGAGVALPRGREIDGESLMPLLRGTGTLRRKAIFWHFPHYRGRTTPYGIVRAGDWKLIKHYETGKYELFNLARDISERNDLSDKMPEKVAELDAMLTDWLKRTGAKLPKPNPNYRPRVKRRRAKR